MGISIHFSGKLKSTTSLPLLVEEVKDISKIHHWPYTVLESTFSTQAFEEKFSNENVYGICFTPPGCELIPLTFLPNGRLINFPLWTIRRATDKEEDESLVYSVSVKTQYAGATYHKLVIHLLDYVSKKYFSSFNLSDEGQYWETRDEALLDKNFALVTGLLDNFSNLLEMNTKLPGESFESYFERLIKELNSKNDNPQQ